MRVSTNGEYSYADYDMGYRKNGTRHTSRSGMFESLHIPRMSQINEHFGITTVRPEGGILGEIWDRLPMIAFWALGIWFVTLILKLFILKDFNAVINTIAWWVMIISAGLLLLGWLLGVFRRIRNWMVNTF